MDGNGRWQTAWRREYVSIVGLGLGMIVSSGGGGCAPEHRCTLVEFLRMEQASATEQQQAAEQETTFEGHRYLGPYRVGRGDVLEVHLAGADGVALFPAALARIDRNGEIELPIIGKIKILDLEYEDIEETIQKAFVPGVYKHAMCHVALASAEPTNVLVTGAVPQPGLVPLRRTERNVLFALSGAGGILETASGRATVRRVERPAEEVTLDLTDPLQMRAALSLEPLEPGDIVHVHPAQPNTIFVGGLVNRPGPQAYPAGTEVTVLQALAAAAGVRTDVIPKEGTLVRRMPNGEDAHVKLDLTLLATGAAPNITLAAGDILWVPETWQTKVQDFINRNVFLRAGVSVNYNVTGVEFLNRRSLQTAQLGGSNLQDSFDPFGFLGRNSLLGDINRQTLP